MSNDSAILGGNQASGDLVVQLRRKGVVYARPRAIGWHLRHAECPSVASQLAKCDGSRFQLLYRGVKEIPFHDEIFVLGLKARPLYAASDPANLSKHARDIATSENAFKELARSFADSSMMKKSKACSQDTLMQVYRSTSVQRRRVRLAQLLLYGLQYQNSKSFASTWRDWLFVLSASTLPDVALFYALNFVPKSQPPEHAFVVEYAPPCGGHCFELLSNVLNEFSSLQLGEWFPDRDSEVLIPFAILPHYVLGYSTLKRVGGGDADPEYSVQYTANPAFTVRGCSLEAPPQLNELQEQKRQELNGQVAWVFHQWIGQDSDWFRLEGQAGAQDISGTRPPRDATP